MPKKEILVIGSKDHCRADCVDWLQPFPNIEEYDAIIINMQSLTQKNYDAVKDKIRAMRDSISTFIITGREVFCIIGNVLHPSPPKPQRFKSISVLAPPPNWVPPSSYNWLPARINFDTKKHGRHIVLRNKRFKTYFDLIHEWHYELSFSQEALAGLVQSFLKVLNAIAVNKSEKILAGSLSLRAEDRKKALEGEKIGTVHLLPPPKESDLAQAVEALIDLIVGTESKSIVLWRKRIEVPNERALNESIAKKLEEIEIIKKEISQLQGQVKSWDSYRDLLTETGEHLENIVQKTLVDLGIKAKKAKKGFPADLLSNEVAVEVTGIKGCLGVGSEKVNQLARFSQNYRKKEKIVLIVNTYMNMPPRERKGKMNFTKEVSAYFDALDVCFMTTMTLFQLWKRVVFGQIQQKNAKVVILTKTGKLTTRDF